MAGPGPMTIADLGAGFPWLSHRLAELGHRVVALDISPDPDFGLGAAVAYPTCARPGDDNSKGGAFFPILGTIDQPPLKTGAYDAVICNASLHYADDLVGTVARMASLLAQGGGLYVVDSPVAPEGARGQGAGSRVLGRAELGTALTAAGLDGRWIPISRSLLWTRHRLKNALLGRPNFDFPILAASRAG
jgi:SAM-dependent methyltransferase